MKIQIVRVLALILLPGLLMAATICWVSAAVCVDITGINHSMAVSHAADLNTTIGADGDVAQAKRVAMQQQRYNLCLRWAAKATFLIRLLVTLFLTGITYLTVVTTTRTYMSLRYRRHKHSSHQ